MTLLSKCAVQSRTYTMQRGSMFCLLVATAVASAASVYGGANLDPNSVGFQGGLVFPTIPGLNSPLFGFSLFPPRLPGLPFGGGSLGAGGPLGLGRPPGPGGPLGPGRPPGPGGPSQRPPFSFPGLPPLPNVNSLIPEIPSNLNISAADIPFSSLPSLSSYPAPLGRAIQLARDHLNTTLDLGNNLADGIQLAINQALNGTDPTAAVRTLVTTILDTYLEVARNCPLIIVGARVLEEGIRLSFEVAQSVRNIIAGNNQ